MDLRSRELVVFDQRLFVEVLVGQLGRLFLFRLFFEVLIGPTHLFIVVSHLSSFVVVR